MIACKSGDGFGANMVEATVAHMGEVELAIYDGESGAGGSHSVELRMLRGITLNILMSGFEGLVEATVAHMGEVELAIYDGESGAGGSHSVELRMLRGITLNILMSGFEGLEQGILRIDAKG